MMKLLIFSLEESSGDWGWGIVLASTALFRGQKPVKAVPWDSVSQNAEDFVLSLLINLSWSWEMPGSLKFLAIAKVLARVDHCVAIVVSWQHSVVSLSGESKIYAALGSIAGGNTLNRLEGAFV